MDSRTGPGPLTREASAYLFTWHPPGQSSISGSDSQSLRRCRSWALSTPNGASKAVPANDILIEEARVCGVLAYTRTMKDVVSSVVLGVGLNVETTPTVPPTPYVPRMAGLRDFGPEPSVCNQGTVLEKLIHALEKNYRVLMAGGYNALLERYRERSIITGREVTVCSDETCAEPEVIATGRVTGGGDNLEFFIEGMDEPVSRGRLILHREDDV